MLLDYVYHHLNNYLIIRQKPSFWCISPRVTGASSWSTNTRLTTRKCKRSAIGGQTNNKFVFRKSKCMPVVCSKILKFRFERYYVLIQTVYFVLITHLSSTYIMIYTVFFFSKKFYQPTWKVVSTCKNKTKTKKYHTVGSVSISNR